MSDAQDRSGGHSSEKGPRWLELVGRPVVLLAAAAVAFGAGVFVQWAFSPAAPASLKTPGAALAGAPGPGAPAQPVGYTCPMHPWIRLPDPDARCPICQMKLVPIEAEGQHAAMTSTFSETAKALMHIETATVERQFVSHTVGMVGKVDYDETRLKYITAWVPGRLDRLFVDYTGMAVRKGYHMVEIYSPELISAQEEFLQARQAVQQLKDDDSQLLRDSAKNTLQAATDKLRLLGLGPQQIAELAASGKPSERVTIYSPAGGIVIRRLAEEGQYVKTGTRIYALADLSEVWIRLDAYESDLIWLRYGQQVQFTTRAYPGQTFSGRISFISPTMDDRTRTVKVRVNASNEAGRLKPNMFVQAAVTSDIDAKGNVIAPDLAGKWISPMHPEIIKDRPGTCDVCGMPLASAESLGFAGVSREKATPPLTIPTSAVLQTGRRAVVYVELPDANQPTYELRQITLGPRAGSVYVVMDGLTEGDRVVARGAFKIDSERQLRGLPSMMRPPDTGASPAVRHAEGHEQHNPAGDR
ncbi:MAG TPA: efflux RND transporter periplasmic adaptor subunit [Phycisphaerae bacterium]|nr:efflux RND transporter periplasmic adaptor subunit [Phycisphaerae bacterium]